MSNESIIEVLKQRKPVYEPREEIKKILAEKSLIALIAPAAEGKSTVMKETARIYPDFGIVTSFTTREPAPRDEPGSYHYYDFNSDLPEIYHLVNAGEVVQYVPHPTTGHIYGSFIKDYPAKYNLFDALFNSVGELEKLPFKSFAKVGLVSPGEEWRQRFLERYPDRDDAERKKRIGEAVLSLEWLLDQPKDEIYWVYNNSIPAASRRINDIALRPDAATKAKPILAEQMLKQAREIKDL